MLNRIEPFVVTKANGDDHGLFDSSVTTYSRMPLTIKKVSCCLANGSLHGGWRI